MKVDELGTSVKDFESETTADNDDDWLNIPHDN